MTDSINNYTYNVMTGVGTVLVQKTNSIVNYTGTVTIPTSNSVVAGTLAATVNGIIRAASLTTPDMQSTNSTNLTLQDVTGGTLWATGTVAELGTTHYGTMVIPVDTTMKFVAIAEGTQAASKPIIFSLHYER
jgi:hypothetical protein